MEHRSLSPDFIVSNDDHVGGNKCTRESTPDVAPQELRKEEQMGGPVNCNDSELSIYLQALAEGYLPTFYSDTSQSAQSKSMSIASKSFRRGKKTVVFHGFPSLKMSRHSTEDLGAALSTWWRADFLARTYRSPEMAPDWTASGQVCGQKWQGLLAKYDHATHSLKTAQLSLLEDLTGCCPTLPRWGLMLDGELYPQPTPALRTEENESGSLEKFPTPNCFDAIPDFADRKDNNLLDGGRHGVSLRHLVKIWPTPTTSASKGSSQNSLTRKDGRSRIGDRLDHSVMASDAGQLNPDWVEWLMGWPIGQTALKPLETGKFQEWQQQHSPCFTETKEAA